jgi:uncharacterized phage protein (TIGR02218 family)
MTTLVRCLTLTPANGAAIGFTEADHPLTLDGVAHAPADVLAGLVVERALGAQPDTARLDAALDLGDTDPASLAGARVQVRRVDRTDPTHRATLFDGRLRVLSVGGEGIRAEARSWRALLQSPIGRRIGRDCDAVLGDARCGVNLAALPAATRAQGCDQRLETCRDRFANAINFRGFAHVPSPDDVIAGSAR